MLTGKEESTKRLADTKQTANDLSSTGQRLVEKISFSESDETAFALVQSGQEQGRPFILSFLNAHGFNLCHTNRTFFHSIMASDVVFRDGIGLKILFKLLKRNPGENLNGTDFIPFLLERLKQQRVALVGTKKNVLLAAAKHPALGRHEVVYCEDGFLPLNDYLRPIADAKPDVVLLGMGMPKQEELSLLLKSHVPGIRLIINGGAILDFMGNKVRRAPLFVRKIGLEWLFRLMLEPRRLFKRYVIGNFIFMKHALKISKTVNA